MRAAASVLFCLAMVALGARVAAARAGAETAEASAPKGYLYDFDRDGDSDGQPDYWERQIDRSHPHYVRAGLDFSVAQDGTGSLRISAGGADAAYLSPAISIEGNSAYDVTAWVMADGLPSAGLRVSSAYVEVRLYGGDGSEVGCVRGFPAATGTTPWTRVYLVDVARKYPGARSMRVAAVLEGLALSGVARFDSIEVKRRPLAFFRMNRAGNAFRYSDTKSLAFEGHGLMPADYTLKLTVLDAGGAKVHEVSLAAPAGADGSCVMQYTLPTLAVGPYSIDLDLSSAGAQVLRQTLRMGILPDYATHETAANFGVSLSLTPEVGSPELALTEFLAAGWGKMRISGADQAGKTAYLQVISELRRDGITPVGVLDALSEPADAASTEDPLLAALLSGPEAWTPLLGDTINTFAGSVQWWQVGDDTDVEMGRLASSPGAWQAIKSFIDGVSFQAQVGLPGIDPAVCDSGPVKPDFCSVGAPQVPTPQAQEALRGVPCAGLWAWLDTAAWARGDIATSTSLVSQEIARLYSAGASVVYLQDPWTGLGMLDSEGNITAFGVAVTNLVHELSNHAYAGTLALPNNTPNAVFTAEGSTKVLLWPAKDPQEEKLFLGDSLDMVDLYGRHAAVPLDAGENVILVDKWPVILSGVDPSMVETRRTFTIEPPLIDSIYRVQPVYVAFTNKFSTAIIGELSLKFPPGWDAEPKVFGLRLRPGESFRGRANLVVPYNALAGPQEMRAMLNIGGAQRTTLVRRSTLGSVAFKMEVETRSTPSGLIVYQKVTNTADEGADIEAFLEGEGLERVERLPRHIDGTASVTFSYTLGDADQWVGKKLRATIRERKTSRFLNVEFTIPDPQAD